LSVNDFDGNPLASDRMAPDAPARDVASMTCAIDHVGRVVARRHPRHAAAASAWAIRAREAFLDAYRAALGDRRDLFDDRLLGPFEVAQEAHEFVYAARGVPGPGIRTFRTFLWFALFAMIARTALVLFAGFAADGGSFSFNLHSIDAGQVANAVLEGLRLGTIIVVFGTFNAVTDPTGVIRLAPRRFHEPALAVALALTIAPRTIEAAQRVREAQALRGIRVARFRSLPALAVPVLETGMEGSVTPAQSMDARGHGRGRRSRYRPQSWTSAATLTVIASLLAIGTFVAARIAGTGDLTPSLSPLRWLEVSPMLLGAIFLLALPALLPGAAAEPPR
jgi:energy-coupling factor transporter transmembrane protein EcfT